MTNQKFILNWDDIELYDNEQRTFQEVLSMPIIEMTHIEFLHTLEADWFSEEFYNLIKKHNFSVVVKSIKTGKKAAIQTFGARFPMVVTEVA